MSPKFAQMSLKKKKNSFFYRRQRGIQLSYLLIPLSLNLYAR